MKRIVYILIFIILVSCDPFRLKPRNVDWKAEWKNNAPALKELKENISLDNSGKFKNGINDFPENFRYPFDQGFFLTKSKTSMTVIFYLDRGLLDHYSAIIYSNDSTKIKEFDRNVMNGGNDYKLEENWYCIND